MVDYGKSENEPRMEANLRSELTEASVCSFESENGDVSQLQELGINKQNLKVILFYVEIMNI